MVEIKPMDYDEEVMGKRLVSVKKESQQFDIRKYLTTQGVHFIESGKNVGEGNIGICCPACDDDNFHMGIRTDIKIYNCWKCEEQGDLVKFISLIEGANYYLALAKIKDSASVIDRSDFQDKIKDVFARKSIEEEKQKMERNLLVPCTKYLHELNSEFELDELFLNFIYERRYTVKELEEWGVRAELFNDYAYRLMFPVTYKKKIVNYVGRTVIDAPNKYKNCSNNDAVFPIKDLLYGYDYVKIGQDNLVICEGVFDVIRFGKGVAVGIFGKAITVNQMELLYSLEIKKRILIVLDGDALRDAEKIAKELQAIVKAKVEVKCLPSCHDPDDYTKKQLKEIIK